MKRMIDIKTLLVAFLMAFIATGIDGYAQATGNAGLVRFEKKGQFGFKDKAGKIVIPANYDYAWEFAEGLAAVQKDFKCGFIDSKGKTALPFSYILAFSFSEGLAAVCTDRKWGYIDKTGAIVIPLVFDAAFSFINGTAYVELNGKTGQIDKSGNALEGSASGLAEELDKTKLLPVKYFENDKWGFKNPQGKVILAADYDEASDFYGDWAAVRQKDRWGYVDREGKTVIPVTLQYDELFGFFDGMARARKGDKYGYIDLTGKEIVKPQYFWADDFENGTARAAKEKTAGKFWHILDLTSAATTAVATDYMYNEGYTMGDTRLYFSDQQIVQHNWEVIHRKLVNDVLRSRGKLKTFAVFGMIDQTGKEIIPCEYASFDRFDDNLYRISERKVNTLSGKDDIAYGLYDIHQGKEVITPKYHSFDMRTFAAKKQIIVMMPKLKIAMKSSFEKVNIGVIDYTGKEIIPLKYDKFDVLPNDRIRIAMQIEEKYYQYGVLDYSGKEIIPLTGKENNPLTDCIRLDLLSDNTFIMRMRSGVNTVYDWDGHIKYASYEEDGKWGWKDGAGATLIPARYDDFRIVYRIAFVDNRIPALRDGKWGYVDLTGKEVIPCIYDHLGSEFSENMTPVALDGKWGLIDKMGKEVVPLIYEEVGGEFSEGLLPARQNGKWGFMDTSGKTIIPFDYDITSRFDGGVATVLRDSLWLTIDRNGAKLKEAVPAMPDAQLIIFKKDGKYGYRLKNGPIVIPARYDDARGFSEGLAPVKQNRRWGYINSAGHVIIPFNYWDAFPFQQRMAPTEKNGKAGYINLAGYAAVPFEYDTYLIGGIFQHDVVKVGVVTKHDWKNARFFPYQWGVVDRTGKIIVPLKYVRLDNTDYGFKFDVFRYDFKGNLVDKNGKIIKQ